jgi:hypothetical protein
MKRRFPSSIVAEFAAAFLFVKSRNRVTLADAQERNRDLFEGQLRGNGGKKVFLPWGSGQPIEKVQSGQGNPRKSKPFSLILCARIWPGLAGF